MKRSATLLIALLLLVPAAVNAQMARGGTTWPSSGMTRGTPGGHGSPFFRGTPAASQAGSPLFWSGGVFGHPIGTNPFLYNNSVRRGFRHHHANNFGGVIAPYSYYPIYPYYPLDWDGPNYQPNADTNNGPTVVYVVPQNGYTLPQAQQQPAPEPAPTESASASPTSQRSSAPEEPQEPTTLVFRDGHTKQISNYAIVGSKLFVFSVPKAEIALADLDIPATVKVNDDRGVNFHVPDPAKH